MTRARVGLLVPARGLGGAERWARDLLGALDHDRFDVTLILPRRDELADYLDPAGTVARVTLPLHEPGPSADSFVGARTSGSRVARALQAVARRAFLARNRAVLARALADLDVDVLHVNNGGYPGASAALAGVVAAHAAGTPSVLTVHSVPQPRVSAWHAEESIDASIASAADRVVVASGAAHQALVERGFDPARIETIPTGIAPPETVTPRDVTRARLGVAESVPAVAMVARFAPPKDHATLLEAMVHVRAEIPGAIAVLAGDGPQRDAVRRRARAMGLEDAIVFPGHDDPFALFRAADVAVLVSRHEGVPLTLIEAMSQTVPVVATDVGGVGDVVDDGVTGLLAPAGDARAVAQRLIDLLRDPALARRIGQGGHDRFREHHQLATMVHRYEALYNAVRHQ